MKKNLLALGALALGFSFNAQTLTYVDEGAKFYVSSGALVYSGGNWVLDSNIEKTVENKGNIMIVGDYKKGTKTNAASDGKEFVNVYTGPNDYGQVQILSSANATDALMTMQRPAASTNYFGADYAIAFPYKDKVTYFMKSFGKTEAEFRGSCGLDVDCGAARYTMNLYKWDNNQMEGDAVTTADKFVAGDYYFINLRPDANLQSAMTGIIGYKGTPDPLSYLKTGKAVIKGQTEASFSIIPYNTWKSYINNYNEYYKTYLGDVDTKSLVYNKNVYRFGNPYTSNLDLSDASGANSWLTILNGGTRRKLVQAYTDQLIKDFTITKRTDVYDVNWSGTVGTTNVNWTYYTAKFDGTQWTGNANALLIKPLETFNLNFPVINPTALGGTRTVNVEVSFKDANKTFKYTPSTPGTSTMIASNMKFSSGSMMSTFSPKILASNYYTAVNIDEFYQNEIFLLKDNTIQADPVYLVGTKYYAMPTAKTTSVSSSMIYVNGINPDETVNVDNKKAFNEFNSIDYVGKPLGLGFNNLVDGNNYELKFNLYEGSIFNNVKDLSAGKFYIKDKLNNKVDEVSASSTYKFTASGDMSNRFEVYWKSVSSGAAGTLATSSDAVTSSKTIIYKDGGNISTIKFENSLGKANVEVYDMSGKLLLTKKNVNTTSDFPIDLQIYGVYVVKVTYANGEVRVLKTIK